jgi:hypothetical protein
LTATAGSFGLGGGAFTFDADFVAGFALEPDFFAAGFATFVRAIVFATVGTVAGWYECVCPPLEIRIVWPTLDEPAVPPILG